MSLNNISLPYPVLGISDDITTPLPEDAISIDVKKDVKTYTFNISLKFNNRDIENLIKEGYAEYSCEYQCARTMIRKCEKSPISQFPITELRHNLSGRIIFKCYVSVKKEIKHYHSFTFNEDYGNTEFHMYPGDVLVIFPESYYNVDIKYDKLQAAGSFMQIRRREDLKDIFFDITHDKIEIQMPAKHYDLFCDSKVRNQMATIHSSLVLNTLTYAMMHVKEYEGLVWADTILQRVKTENQFEGLEIEEPSHIPIIAQRMLKDPYMRLFNEIKNTMSNMLDE